MYIAFQYISKILINFKNMINNFFILKEGGLFDFDLTLPVIILEFLFLSFFLNIILFTPIQDTIEKRKFYINQLSNEISLLVKKGEILFSVYENILAKQKFILNNDNLFFNQACDSIFDQFLKNISDWNFNEIEKSKSILAFQTTTMFGSFDKVLKDIEQKVYKYLVS